MEIDTTDLELIGEADNAAPGRMSHTRLALFYAPQRSTGKAFVAQVQAFYNDEQTKVFQVYVGNLDRALEWFKPSELTKKIKLLADDWWEMNEPRYDTDMNEQALPDPVGIETTRLVDVLGWLYQGETGDAVEKAAQDFEILPDTLRQTVNDEASGKSLPSWARAFVNTMKFFDRVAWQKAR